MSEAFMLDPLVNTSSAPDDFDVGRIEHQFDCESGVLAFTFSGGTCTNASEPELRFLFDINAIVNGQVRQGQIEARSDDSPGNAGVSVRFSRARGSDAGEWGSCGVPTGSIDLRETPSLEEDGVFAGGYNLSLPACGSTDAEPVIVAGTFNVVLSVSHEEACGSE